MVGVGTDNTLSETLKRLEVVVKGGGSIISHPPIFAPDSKTIYIVQNNTLFLHDTQSGRCVGKFCTPSASPIANVGVSSLQADKILVFTSSGQLLFLQVSTLSILWTKELIWRNKQWPPVTTFVNFIWPCSLSFDPPPSKSSHFFVVGYSDNSTLPNLYSVQFSNGPQLSYRHECRGVLGNMHSISSSRDGGFLAAVQKDHLFVKNMTNNVCKWHKSGTREFTCVAVHPSDWICATGDDSGRILLWTNLLEGNNQIQVTKSVYHWHTLPIGDLCFSASGSQIYSGGGECALVKWDLNGTGNKRVLPRLGLPIRHVQSSLTDEVIAISQADNGIKLINAYNEVYNQIQNLTQSYVRERLEDINFLESSFGGLKSKVFQAGLVLDPNNESLVTNGRPGHLQCYSFKEDRHLYSLDITQQNFITAERNNPIQNSDVNHAQFSKNGTWLVTSESRMEEEKCTELRLKFWKFEKERQIFVLNTSIDWPHEGGIQGIRIQPIPDSDPTLVAVTSGFDKKFKTWGVVHDKSIHGKNEWWNCEFVGTCRGMEAGPSSFSEDGSLLGVAFEQILTVWTTDNNQLKLTLCHSNLNESIRLLEFGAHQSAHLAIVSYSKNLAVWDIITASLLWVAPFEAESISVDPLSNLAAAFSMKHHLILFAPDQSTPLAVHKNVSSSRVVSSIFVPTGKAFESLKFKSTLFFINASQELCALLPPKDHTEETLRISSEAGRSILTPFAQLVAEKTVYETQNKTSSSSALNQKYLEGQKILREIMDQSPHTMPSLTYYCSRLLQTLSIRRSPGEKQAEIEQTALASFKKRNNQSMADDESDTDAFPFPSIATPKELSPHTFEEIDLDAVMNDDKTWINKIFQIGDI